LSFGPSWQPLLRASPVFARELRQALRTGRTIVLVLVLAVLVGLFTLAIAGAFGMGRAPINVGPILFQVFFSLAYFIVGIIGPTMAAIELSSEKDGRTWEALVLTGMDVRAVARGKFWTSISAMAALLLMIAPASLLCALLGGVRIAELVVAFALLAIIAVVAVAFGVSVGARAQGTASATLIALVSALGAAPFLYFAVGVGLSFFAHATWPDVPSGLPIWLPLAYSRAHFDGWYLILLILLPVTVVLLSLWFFYETTVQRLSSESDDRTTGLKRWYLVSLPLVGAIASIPGFMTRGPSRPAAFTGGLGALSLFLAFCAFVFAGDALAVSRRIEYRWHKRKAGWVTRVLGPGLVQTSMVLLVTSLLGMGLFAVVGALVLSKGSPLGLPPTSAVGLLTCGEYWSAFLVFVVGFLLWSRVRADSVGAARILSIMVAVCAIVAPWIAFLIFGYAASKRIHDALLIAAPSPLYALAIVSAIDRGEPHLALTSGLVCSLGWISMGLSLFGLGARRATRVVAEHRTAVARLETTLSREARHAVRASLENPAPTDM
jgi:hypothetical protein